MLCAILPAGFTKVPRLTTDALSVVQVASYIYYVLSYIPYGRKGAQKLVKAALSVRPRRLQQLLQLCPQPHALHARVYGTLG